MQLLALGWCTSLISDSGLAIVNKNMHAEIVAVKGNSMTRFSPGFSYLPFMCSPCCIFYLALPRLLCLYTANRLFPLFSVDFSGERKRLGGSRVRRHHSSTDRSLFIAREDNGTCLIFDATPDTAYVNHFSRANIFQYDSKQVDPATSSPLGCCATSLKLPSLAFSLSLRSLRTYERST